MTSASNTRHAVELLIGASVSAVLTIAAMIYAGRVMGPAQYADFSAALAVIYLATLALSPVLPSVARVAARYATNDRIAAVVTLRRSVMRIALIAVVIATTAAAIVVRPAAQWLRLASWTTLAWAVLAAIVYVLLSIDRGFLQGLFRFREYNMNTLIESVVRAGLIFALARIIPTASFAMMAWAAGTLIAQAMVSVSLARVIAQHAPELPEWNDLLGLLRPMVGLMIALAIFQNTDVIAVKRFMTAQEAGGYGAASALSRGFGVLFVPLYAMAGPMLTEAREKKRDVFAATLKLTFAYLGLVTVPLLIVTGFGPRLMTSLYGGGYAIAGGIIAPLSVVTVITYVALMLSQALLTIDDHRFVWMYIACAIAQVAGLAVAHESYRHILTVLYVCQGATLLFVTITFLHCRKRTRERVPSA